MTLSFKVTNETFADSNSKLHFNLVAPTDSLLMTVSNLDGVTLSATDGFIEFLRSELAGDLFFIKISKLPKAEGHFVHLTLIVTNTESALVLDSTTTHYERFGKKTQKKFIVEFDPNQQNMINFYTETLEKTHGKFAVSIADINLQDADE